MPADRGLLWLLPLCSMEAVGEPFLTGKEAWLEKAKLFMQFRAIGRFTWPAVWAFPVLAVWWARQQHKYVLGLVVACFGLDGFWMQQEARVQMDPMPNGFHAASPAGQTPGRRG